MKSKIIIPLFLLLIILLNGCTGNYGLTIWRPMDILKFPLFYVFFAFVFAKLLENFGNKENKSFRHFFWRTIIFTPVYGLIVLILRFNK